MRATAYELSQSKRLIDERYWHHLNQYISHLSYYNDGAKSSSNAVYSRLVLHGDCTFTHIDSNQW